MCSVVLIARILKAHSHSMSGSSIWTSLECHCCFWIAGGLVSYLTMWLLTLVQLFKNSIDTPAKLRLNFHSMSVSELLEYGRKTCWFNVYVEYYTPQEQTFIEDQVNDCIQFKHARYSCITNLHSNTCKPFLYSENPHISLMQQHLTMRGFCSI
jgi:hypothetical protein